MWSALLAYGGMGTLGLLLLLCLFEAGVRLDGSR